MKANTKIPPHSTVFLIIPYLEPGFIILPLAIYCFHMMIRLSKSLLRFQSKRHNFFYFNCKTAVLCFFLFACTGQQKQKQFVIGFSQCLESNLWRKAMLEGMKRELNFHPNIAFIYKQADGNCQKQIEQVGQLVKQKVDLLIISPQESKTLAPIVEETYKKGIPVIVLDREIATSSFTAYVGGSNYEIGKMAGQYAGNLLQGKGKVIEIAGLFKATPAIQRHDGFTDALKNQSSLHIVQRVNLDPRNPNNIAVLSKIADQHPDVDLIFAHNDLMARDANEAYKRKGGLNMPLIIGVDGLPGKEAGMQMVSDKILAATMLYPTGGEEAIQTALKILNKEDFKKVNHLETTVIDSTNVRVMQLQAAKVNNQQKDIEKQDAMLKEQKKMYNTQQSFLYVLAFTLILALTLAVISFYSLRENRKVNASLELQNQKISDQKNQLELQKKQLEIISEKAKVANEAKVNFFTNISHEFRTPLTLILAPLEELLAYKNQHHNHQSLVLIQKNVIRLLRLVNQLMDFRKIEVDKMKIRAYENDMIAFVADIVQTYKSLAQKRGINLQLLTQERQLNAFFDPSMIDKVIFNLLTNAFKFTGDNGFIHVHIKKSEDGNQAIIEVEDNGVGMTPDAVEHAFDMFYQGEFENYKGSGIGLALSKELIQLHKGTVTVRSEKWKGTSFQVTLPLCNVQLENAVAVENEFSSTHLYEQEKIYVSDLQPDIAVKEEVAVTEADKEFTILLIEDNADLKHFLAARLGKLYEVVETDSAQSALQQAFDIIPDLIICDIVIPGKDGMALTHIFKNDIRTSHIPVILLTAKTAVEQQIEGMKNLADAYIIKPFNVALLEQTIKSLIANRARLKEHFTCELSSNLRVQTTGKLDRKFINEFTSLVEENVSNDEFKVENICNHMGISRIQLYRKVKALMNMNVNDYILNTRLQKAKYLLQQEEYSISEIAYKVGFSSPTYFTAVFKTKFGVTPKVFKAS